MTAVAITGASGLIGRHLCEHFRAQGWNVRALMRRPERAAFVATGISAHRLDLPHDIPTDALRGADVVIHAAYATRASEAGAAPAVNEAGTERLLAASRVAGARFVFVSSLSARPDAASYYGRSKLAMEQRLDQRRDLVIRPGLVLASDGGLALRMWRTVAAARVMPLFDAGRQVVQTVHVDDLCAAIFKAVSGAMSGTLCVAEPTGMTMRELLAAFAAAAHVRAVALPVPSAPVLGVLRAAERVGLPSPVTADNLLGLLTLQPVDTAPDIARLGVRVRTARESIADLAPDIHGP